MPIVGSEVERRVSIYILKINVTATCNKLRCDVRMP